VIANMQITIAVMTGVLLITEEKFYKGFGGKSDHHSKD
jgi:hypothetical protein